MQFRFNTGHEHSTNAGLGKQSRHTMISLMELQLGKNRGIPLFWQVKKDTDFIAILNFPSKRSLKDLTLKLAKLLALTSAARVSEILS